ncbi:anthranilate synthase component II, partial [Buchnera aphidicola (Hormaphis cornu)]
MADILFLDNKDSFTYNLVDQLRTEKHKVIIYRNNIALETITNTLKKLCRPIIMLSPGPGFPHHSGCMMPLIKIAQGKIPVVGICLG